MIQGTITDQGPPSPFLEEGCDNLYPVTIQGPFTDQGPLSPQINGAICDDNTVVYASTDSCDDTVNDGQLCGRSNG